MSVETVVISIGQTRKFSLQSSAGTGYVWMLAELPPGAWLEAVEDSGAGGPGGPSTRTFSLFGAKEGAGTLRFALARPWEPLSVADQRVYSVRVQPSTIIVPLYAAALQQAKASGDTGRMRELAAQAEQQLGSSADIQSALADVKEELGKQQHSTIHPLYGVAIQQAIRSGDLSRMKALAAQAEEHAGGNAEIAAALPALKAEIAKHGQNAGFSVPPYGVAIQQAIARGDLEGMKKAKADAERYIADVQGALDGLKGEISRHEGKGAAPVPLYAVSIHQAAASGDLARMKVVAAQADALSDQSPEIKSALAELKAQIAKAKG
jgi:hypothetical protein